MTARSYISLCMTAREPMGRMAGVGVIAFAFVTALAPVSPTTGATTGQFPLRVAGATITYEDINLTSLATCHIFDGLTILKNVGSVALHITSINAVIPTDLRSSPDRVVYQVRSLRSGTTQGAVGAVESMNVLGGTNIGGARGATLLPVGSHPLWYVVVFRMAVLHPRSAPWAIRGVRVTYRSGTTTYHAFFPQTVRLPATTC